MLWAYKNAHKNSSKKRNKTKKTKKQKWTPTRHQQSGHLHNPPSPCSYLAGPLWPGPAPAPSGPAARGARWQRVRLLSSLPGSPPGLYSACPSSAAAGSPPPAAGPLPHAAGLQRENGRWAKLLHSRSSGWDTGCGPGLQASTLLAFPPRSKGGIHAALTVTDSLRLPTFLQRHLTECSVSQKVPLSPNFGSEPHLSGAEPPTKWWNWNVKGAIKRKAERKQLANRVSLHQGVL